MARAARVELRHTLDYIALVVFVFELSGRGLAVAGLVAIEIVPVLVLGPVAGVLIDRVSRKSVLVGADLFRAALVLSLLWPQGVGHAYLVGLAAGNVFLGPALNAVIPALTTPPSGWPRTPCPGRPAGSSRSWPGRSSDSSGRDPHSR